MNLDIKILDKTLTDWTHQYKRVKHLEQVRIIPAVQDEYVIWKLIKLIYYINKNITDKI